MSQQAIDGVLAAWNEGKIDELDAVMAPEAVRRAPASLNSSANNREEFKGRIAAFRGAFPDAKVVVDDVHFVDNRAFFRWTFTGTNTGPGDFPPTGKAVKVSGATHARFKDGKLTEELVFLDAADMLSQLGLLELP